jgi:hypothetical protein
MAEAKVAEQPANVADDALNQIFRQARTYSVSLAHDMSG